VNFQASNLDLGGKRFKFQKTRNREVPIGGNVSIGTKKNKKSQVPRRFSGEGGERPILQKNVVLEQKICLQRATNKSGAFRKAVVADLWTGEQTRRKKGQKGGEVGWGKEHRLPRGVQTATAEGEHSSIETGGEDSVAWEPVLRNDIQNWKHFSKTYLKDEKSNEDIQDSVSTPPVSENSLRPHRYWNLT